MKYVREDDRLIIRLNPGEEVIECLEELRAETGLEQGFLMGIGAVNEVVLGHYDVELQEYNEEKFTGQFEVTSFLGNVGPDKVHTHIQLGTDTFRSLGGHCSEAVVSGTFEIVVFPGSTPLEHSLHEETGLDIFDL